MSKSCGQTYYINVYTNDTQYDFPEGAAADPNAARVLPAGWESGKSRSGG